MGPAELDPEMVPQFPGLGTPRHLMRKGSNTPEGKEKKGDQFVTSLSISKTCREEIKDYSVAYFDCIPAFEVPLNFRGSYVLCRLVSYSSIYEVGMSPAFNGSSIIQCFKHSDQNIQWNNLTGLSLYMGTQIFQHSLTEQ